jgi:uncharacterized protein (TIGR03067 family)
MCLSRLLCLLFAWAACTCILGANPPKDDAVKAELDKLQGVWVAAGVEENGVEDTSADARAVLLDASYTIKESRWSMTGKLAGKRLSVSGTIKLDPGTSPKRIDILLDSGPNKGKTMLGIYEAEGDELRVRWGKPGEDDRPAQLKTKKGDSFIVELYRRKK